MSWPVCCTDSPPHTPHCTRTVTLTAPLWETCGKKSQKIEIGSGKLLDLHLCQDGGDISLSLSSVGLMIVLMDRNTLAGRVNWMAV